MGTYHPESMIATEFIDDAEIQETLEFAKEHANDVEMAREILNKGAKCKGLSYREAAVLLECEDETIKQEISEDMYMVEAAYAEPDPPSTESN